MVHLEGGGDTQKAFEEEKKIENVFFHFGTDYYTNHKKKRMGNKFLI